MDTIKARFSLEKETKGALRYSEVDKKGEKVEFANVVVGTLYLRKSALNGSKPEKLTVTISE